MEPGEHAWEERALRQSVLAGDQRAWRVLYDRSFAGLYGYVYCRVNRQPHRAEEVVQETWLVAVRRLGVFDPSLGCFESRLKGIADKVLLNQRRRWARDATAAGPVEEAPDLNPHTATAAEAREVLALAMTAIPGHYQSVLRAKYEEQLSVAEIASRAGATIKSIESLLVRAREAFRDSYRRLCGE